MNERRFEDGNSFVLVKTFMRVEDEIATDFWSFVSVVEFWP